MMQTLSPNKHFFCQNTIVAGLKKVETTHNMGAKRPTSETTHGLNNPVPGVSMDRLPLIFRRLVIP